MRGRGRGPESEPTIWALSSGVVLQHLYLTLLDRTHDGALLDSKDVKFHSSQTQFLSRYAHEGTSRSISEARNQGEGSSLMVNFLILQGQHF